MFSGSRLMSGDDKEGFLQLFQMAGFKFFSFFDINFNVKDVKVEISFGKLIELLILK